MRGQVARDHRGYGYPTASRARLGGFFAAAGPAGLDLGKDAELCSPVQVRAHVPAAQGQGLANSEG